MFFLDLRCECLDNSFGVNVSFTPVVINIKINYFNLNVEF